MLRDKIDRCLTKAQVKELRIRVLADSGQSRRSYDYFLTDGRSNIPILIAMCDILGCTPRQLYDMGHSFTGLVTPTVTSITEAETA